MASTCAATFSARLCGEARAVGVRCTLATPAICAAALRGFGGVGAGHQHVHVAAAARCAAVTVLRVAGLDGGVVVFGDDECGHVMSQITLASFFSLATSVATSGTLMPAPRLGGSLTFSVFRRGLTSTPRSSGLTMSSCFFLAFMMLGSVT